VTEKLENVKINDRVEKVSGCKLRRRVVTKGGMGLQTGEARREMQIKEAQM
jgi:hypothetical protein